MTEQHEAFPGEVRTKGGLASTSRALAKSRPLSCDEVICTAMLQLTRGACFSEITCVL